MEILVFSLTYNCAFLLGLILVLDRFHMDIQLSQSCSEKTLFPTSVPPLS